MTVAECVKERIEEMVDEVTSDPFYNGKWEFPYAQATWAAENSGGKEIENSNWDAGTSGQSFAPTIVYKFSDNSRIRITYSNAWVMK